MYEQLVIVTRDRLSFRANLIFIQSTPSKVNLLIDQLWCLILKKAIALVSPTSQV